MSQNSFIPTGSETHLDARAVWNGNATDAESRLTSLESGSARAVDSVNTQTGVVVLDADDIDDSATTNKFATQGELDKANTALQPTDPTLASVTTNGATTVNNISVGTIATLHPTNTANDNVATGQQSASIGGRRNIASGTRATTFGGVSNTVSGTDSTAVGGNNQEVIGVESEALGSTNLFLYTKYTSALGTANSKVGLATSAATSVEAKHSVIVGGEAQTIEDAAYAAILGGAVNKVLSTHDRSVILGGANIITDASDTAYVPSLNIKSGFKMPTGASNTYVLTSDANGVGTWQAAAGGPAGPSGTVLSGTTANATPTEIFVDGTSPNRVDVATGSTITFSALVAARSATESAGYKIEGVIKNDAGTAALVGVVAKTVFAEEDIAWDITVTAANNALTFIVTGDSADSVSWEVTLNKTEAT